MGYEQVSQLGAKCEKCGKHIEAVEVHTQYDAYLPVAVQSIGNDIAIADILPEYLPEQDPIKEIRCPCCKEYPFNSDNVSGLMLIRLIMQKHEFADDDEIREEFIFGNGNEVQYDPTTGKIIGDEK